MTTVRRALRIVGRGGITCVFTRGSGHTSAHCVKRPLYSELIYRHTSRHTLTSAHSLVRYILWVLYWGTCVLSLFLCISFETCPCEPVIFLLCSPSIFSIFLSFFPFFIFFLLCLLTLVHAIPQCIGVLILHSQVVMRHFFKYFVKTADISVFNHRCQFIYYTKQFLSVMTYMHD